MTEPTDRNSSSPPSPGSQEHNITHTHPLLSLSFSLPFPRFLLDVLACFFIILLLLLLTVTSSTKAEEEQGKALLLGGRNWRRRRRRRRRDRGTLSLSFFYERVAWSH